VTSSRVSADEPAKGASPPAFRCPDGRPSPRRKSQLRPCYTPLPLRDAGSSAPSSTSIRAGALRERLPTARRTEHSPVPLALRARGPSRANRHLAGVLLRLALRLLVNSRSGSPLPTVTASLSSGTSGRATIRRSRRAALRAPVGRVALALSLCSGSSCGLRARTPRVPDHFVPVPPALIVSTKSKRPRSKPCRGKSADRLLALSRRAEPGTRGRDTFPSPDRHDRPPLVRGPRATR